MDRSSRQKTNKATELLKETIEKLDLIDIFNTQHPKNQNTHSSQVHRDHSQESTMYLDTRLTSMNLGA